MSIFRLTSAKMNVVCFGNWRKYDVDLGNPRMHSSHLERQCFIKINVALNIIKRPSHSLIILVGMVRHDLFCDEWLVRKKI